MKGFVVNVWFQTWSKMFGKDFVDKIKAKYGISPDHVYSPIDDVPDDLPLSISRDIAAAKGVLFDDLWYQTGRQNLFTFFEHYPDFFKKPSCMSFLCAMDSVHRVLTRKIQGAKPPRVFFRMISDRKAVIRYQSKRNFKKYFLGLMESSAEFFKDPIKYKILADGSENGYNYLEVEIEASKPYGFFDKVRAFALLGFGFVKNLVPIYVLFVPLYTFVVSYLVGRFLPADQLFKSLLTAGVVSGLLYTASVGLKRGFTGIKRFAKNMSEKNFDEPVVLEGISEFKEISEQMNNAVDQLKEVLLGISGDIQEMSSYSQKVVTAVNAMKEQLGTMSSLSNEIANTAVQISNDTERISNAVTSNVETITSIMREQTEIVKSLNDAVVSIVESAKNVENSADGIVSMSKRFAELVELGRNLQQQASTIMEVATTVSSIAEQTNLLALNAAIEAARSGEAGRGFAVVADEIRKLAEESRASAAKISDFLKSITNGIENLGKSIQAEFNEMQQQSQLLLESSARNKQSSDVISSISKKLSQLIETLNMQAEKLNNITSSIQNLLAISEESSATAEEISSSIQNFFTQLKVVLDSVNETIRLLDIVKMNFEGVKL